MKIKLFALLFSCFAIPNLLFSQLEVESNAFFGNDIYVSPLPLTGDWLRILQAAEGFMLTTPQSNLLLVTGGSDHGVGINTLNPEARLHVSKGQPTGAVPNPNSISIFESLERAYLSIITPNDKERGILFGDQNNTSTAGIIYNNVANSMLFRTNGNVNRMIITGAGQVGIGTTSPSYQLQLTQNSAAKPISSTWSVASDLRLKENVQDFTDGLSVINNIRPVSFSYNGKAGMPIGETAIGTIAQELQEIAPYMVEENSNKSSSSHEKYLAVDYHSLPLILVNAVKEQQDMIESLQHKNDKLIQRLNELEAVIKG